MHKKVLNSLALVLSTALIMSCSTKSNDPSYYRSSANSNLVASPTGAIYSPTKITIYDENNASPPSAQVITIIQVDVYNEYGIRRQQAQINEMLKEQACLLGGDAIVIIKNPDKKHCYARVIQTKPAINNEAPSPSTLATTPKSATKSGNP